MAAAAGAAALLAAVAAALLPGGAGPAAAARSAAAPAAVRAAHNARSAALTRAIRRVMRQASVPGAIVGVWQRDRRPYVRAFGVRDKRTRRAMSTVLYMRIGSETKTFTVTALLQLADGHKVGLDDPIGKYVSGVPEGNVITLRELAEMRSGLFDYTSDPALLRAHQAHPRRQWAPRELLAYSFSHPLLFPPGTKFSYSNTNTILLGLVIEKMSHEYLGRYIARHILRPEHLPDTSFPASAYFPRPHAQGYTNDTPDGSVVNATTWNPSWAWAAGAMISTLGGLRAWAKDVATGDLLTPAMQRQRERFLPTGAKGQGYGLGLACVNGWIGHDGAIPGYLSLTIYLPSQRATVVVLFNTDIEYRGVLPVDLAGQAITKIITPRHVY